MKTNPLFPLLSFFASVLSSAAVFSVSPKIDLAAAQGKLFDLMTSSDFWLPFIVIAVAAFIVAAGLIWLLTSVLPDDWEDSISETCAALVWGISLGFLASPLLGSMTQGSAWRSELAEAMGISSEVPAEKTRGKPAGKAMVNAVKPRASAERTKTVNSSTTARKHAASNAQTALPPAPVVNSVERDKALVGIAQAIKASDHAGAMKLIEGLERNGLGMPAALQYFKAESLYVLKRYTEADLAVKTYLDQGNSARYYEEALKLSLSIDRGLEGMKKQWRSELDSLLSALSTRKGMDGSWTMTADNEQFRCRIYSDHTFVPTGTIEGQALKISVKQGDSQGRSECRSRNGERAHGVGAGRIEFEDAGMNNRYQDLTIPFHRLGDVRVQEKYAKCKGDYNIHRKVEFYCPRSTASFGRYSVISLDGNSIYLMDSSLSAKFARVADLYRQLGGDVN